MALDGCISPRTDRDCSVLSDTTFVLPVNDSVEQDLQRLFAASVPQTEFPGIRNGCLIVRVDKILKLSEGVHYLVHGDVRAKRKRLQ